MVAVGYAGVSDLIGRVKCELGTELYDRSGIHVARGIIAGVPLGCEREAFIDGLFESELPAGAVGFGDDVARKVVRSSGDARTALPFLGERGVGIIPRVVGPKVYGKNQIVSNKKRPSRRLGFPNPPFHRRRNFVLFQSGGAEPVEVHSHFDSVPDANHHTRSKCREKVHWADRAVQFAIYFSVVQDVSARHVENGFLGVGAA